MILFKAIKDWAEERIFSFLCVNGMVACPVGDSPTWRHVRLDWFLILSAIASEGISICGCLWLVIGGYWQGVACLVLGWIGWLDTLKRRDELIRARNVEFQIATHLREMGAMSCNVNVGCNRELDFSAQFSQPETAAALTTALRKTLSAKSDHICHYFSQQSSLPCAVHPGNLKNGLCNENCPDFKPR